MDIQTIRFHLDRVVRALIAIEVFLLMGSVAGQLSRIFLGYDNVKGLVPMFNVNQEQNLPTFFSVLLALSCALLLTITGTLTRADRKRDVAYWFTLAFGFLFLSYDEAFQVHERMMAPMRTLMGGHATGLLYFAWVVPAILGVAAILAVFAKFVLRLPPATRRGFILSCAIYIGGCIGMELLSGRHVEVHGPDLIHAMMTTIEEGMEMLGLIWFIRTLLIHITTHHRHVILDLGATVRPVANP